MKITKNTLKRLIKEEMKALYEREEEPFLWPDEKAEYEHMQSKKAARAKGVDPQYLGVEAAGSVSEDLAKIKDQLVGMLRNWPAVMSAVGSWEAGVGHTDARGTSTGLMMPQTRAAIKKAARAVQHARDMAVEEGFKAGAKTSGQERGGGPYFTTKG